MTIFINMVNVQIKQEILIPTKKIGPFLQKILPEIKLTSCTKKFPSINGSWQSAHTKQVGCHCRSKNNKNY